MKRNILGAFPTESVILHKASGKIIDNIDALVESNKFFIDDANIVIEEGDFFERNLPNGSKEYYRVTDRGFYKGMHEIPDHYQTSVEKVEVSVGISDGTYVEITSGLEEGDTYCYSVLDVVNYSSSYSSSGNSAMQSIFENGGPQS